MSQFVGITGSHNAIVCRACFVELLLLSLTVFHSVSAQAVPIGTTHGAATGQRTCERWGIAEIQLTGPRNGNPFVDVQLSATFELDDEKRTVAGFYDGNGEYRIRFMPEKLGEWRYATHSNVAALDGKRGQISVIPPTGNNNGP